MNQTVEVVLTITQFRVAKNVIVISTRMACIIHFNSTEVESTVFTFILHTQQIIENYLIRYLASECLQAMSIPLMMSTFLFIDYKTTSHVHLTRARHGVLTAVPVIDAISLNFLYTVTRVSLGGANIIF